MPGTPSVAILRDIQTLFDLGTAAGMTDRQLLERFADGRDPCSDAAFEFLILRHGPMILRVCRNVLRDEADVADAFQATFLVLVRRRETLRRLESVGGWLYGVACRVAARARVDAARRQKAEQRAALRVVEAVDPAEDIPMNREFGPVVQEEVRRLPEKYRAVVVLCYWQSLTHDQAAAQIGCPLGTVRSRLARARKFLHRRLTRRGLAPLAALVTTALDGSTGWSSPLAAVPAALVKQTIHASAAAASGQALSYIVSGATASLVKRVLWSLAMINIKTAGVGLALVSLLGFGTAFVAIHARPGHAQSERKNDTGVAQPAQRKDPPGTALVYQRARDTLTILKIVPDGSTVKKGDVICEFNSAELADQLDTQHIAAFSARGTHENRVAASEIANLSLKEYSEYLYKIELAEIEAAILKAEGDLTVALDTEKAAGKIPSGRSFVKSARFALSAAQLRKQALLEVTRPKRVKELELAVATAKTEELTSKVLWEVAESRSKRLERLIGFCKILAPRDGKLVYYCGPEGSKPRLASKADGSTAPWPFIEVGAQVQPNQLLFKIVPVTEPAVPPK